MDLYNKLLEVSRLFKIEYEYLGYEVIKGGNVHSTYKVNFMLPEGKPKSFLVQNVNTYAFRNPVGLMDNIDKITEHIRAKKRQDTAYGADSISLRKRPCSTAKTAVNWPACPW